MHLILSLILLLPFTQIYRDYISGLVNYSVDPTLLTMNILLFLAAFINSLQIRVPNLKEKLARGLGDLRKKILDALELFVRSSQYVEAFENINKIISRYEEKLLEFVSSVERDYELRYGYVCITFALLSITISYVFFNYLAIYGVLALAIVDTLSSIVSMFTQNRRKILKHTDISIAVTFSVFTVLLYLLCFNIIHSIILSLVAIVVELISPEDNLTLPITVTLASHIMNTL